jgi:CRP/FNR family transcriptional regulator
MAQYSGAKQVAGGYAAQAGCASLVDELRRLDKLKFSKYYTRGSVLFREGQQAHGVYVLSEGRAKVSISSAEGKTLVLRIAKPGDLLGLYAGLTGRPYEATAEMLEPGRIEFISREGFLDLMRNQRPISVDLMQVLSDQFSEFVEHARLLMLSESALEKLARLIVRWSHDFGEHNGDGVSLQILLTQQEIGQIIGASRETVTRLFSSLKRKQIIHVSGHGMLIRNPAALATLAQMPA